MDVIIPNWVGTPTNISAFSTTRRGGVSVGPYDDGAGSGGLNLGSHVGDLEQHVQYNRARLQTYLPRRPLWLTQVHGTDVINAADMNAAESRLPPEADASITTQAGVVCIIQAADCLPVLFCDRNGHVVGAAHAGWRGLLAGVLENTVMHMRNAGAEEILAWLGPAIGPGCFEVGKEVVDAFWADNRETISAFKPIPERPGKFLADLYALAKKRLNNSDVYRIYGGGLCTMTDQQRFYSYRRDGITGRMASLIWINEI